MTHTKLYEATSVHTIGYSWAIVAPAELTELQVSLLCKAIVEWTDTPNDEDYQTIIRQGYLKTFFEDEDEELPSLELLERVEIQTRQVHRESYLNDDPKQTAENPHDFI